MASKISEEMLRDLSKATACTVEQLRAAFDLQRLWARREKAKDKKGE